MSTPPTPAAPAGDPVRGGERPLHAAILETALDGVVIIDEHGRVLDFNPAAEEIFGWKREEAMGREMAELIVPPALRERHRHGLQRAVETGQNTIMGRRIEITGQRRNGEIFPCELAIARLSGVEGVPRFAGQIRDLTPRRRLEARQTAQYGVARVLAASATLAAAAPRLLSLIGEAMGWPAGLLWRAAKAPAGWQCVAPPESLPAILTAPLAAESAELPARAGQSGEPAWLQTPPAAPTPRQQAAQAWPGALAFPIHLGAETLGVLEFFSATSQPPDAEVLEWLQGLGSQIAQFIERHEAEEELRRVNAELTERTFAALQEAAASEDLFYKVFHSNPAAMTLSRVSDLQFVDVNAAFERGTGHSRAAAIGVTGDELGVWIEGPARELFYQGLATKGAIHEMEITFVSSTGKIDHVILSAEVIELRGEPHLLTVGIDNNARRLAAAELQQALEKEKELGRLKSSFVTLVSHEFRTPLGIIMSAADILAAYFERLTPAQRGDHLTQIHEASRHMSDLMEEVLLLGRVEAGKLQFQPRPLDPAAWSQRLVDEMLSATNRRCQILLEVEESAAGEGMGDESLLRHIFSNLLSNGVKYSSPGSNVVLSLTRQGTEAHFEVRDCGIGILPEDLGRLFETFRRGSNVGEVAGSGLGLTIVKHCVTLHGGEIAIESQPGVGTLARVRLPLYSAHPSPGAPAAAPSAA